MYCTDSKKYKKLNDKFKLYNKTNNILSTLDSNSNSENLRCMLLEMYKYAIEYLEMLSDIIEMKSMEEFNKNDKKKMRIIYENTSKGLLIYKELYSGSECELLIERIKAVNCFRKED